MGRFLGAWVMLGFVSLGMTTPENSKSWSYVISSLVCGPVAFGHELVIAMKSVPRDTVQP